MTPKRIQADYITREGKFEIFIDLYEVYATFQPVQRIFARHPGGGEMIDVILN